MKLSLTTKTEMLNQKAVLVKNENRQITEDVNKFLRILHKSKNYDIKYRELMEKKLNAKKAQG